MKITNRWESFKTNVVQYKVQFSGGGTPILDQGEIKFGETHQVPDEVLEADKVYLLTVTSENENVGEFYSIKLTKLSDVTIVVTNPYQG